LARLAKKLAGAEKHPELSFSQFSVFHDIRSKHSKGAPVAIALSVNGKTVSVDTDPSMPLLWVLRDALNMTGTKFGCGLAQCGACTVHVDGEPVRACVTPASSVVGKRITTIEGLSAQGDHPLQKAWIIEQAPQCGYCQSGQIMQAAALLAKNKTPSRAQIVEHMAGNICRTTRSLPPLSAPRKLPEVQVRVHIEDQSIPQERITP
jgi:isoquinoline 1-oxidoreductase subunit alpha